MIHETDDKIKISCDLSKEAVDWITSEAAENNMTTSEIIESLVFTVKCMTELMIDETNTRSSWMLSQGGDA